MLAAIIAGVDVVDTNCWYFAEGTGAPAIELVHVFCKKLGVDTGVNMEAVAKINTQLREIRKELNQSVFGTEKPEPKPFNPLTDTLPAEIDALFDKAIKAAQADDEAATIDACRKIEAYFGFPAPNELVQKAEIPGGMYSNMVAQLKQLKAEDILPRAMELIPSVRLAAGLPPLVTPTSQIVGAHAVGDAVTGGGETVAQAAAEPVYWNYGAFIQQCIDFTILAFCVFMMVKLMNRLMKKKEEAPAPAAEPVLSKEEQLLTEIRDLLKEQKK